MLCAIQTRAVSVEAKITFIPEGAFDAVQKVSSRGCCRLYRRRSGWSNGGLGPFSRRPANHFKAALATGKRDTHPGARRKSVVRVPCVGTFRPFPGSGNPSVGVTAGASRFPECY